MSFNLGKYKKTQQIVKIETPKAEKTESKPIPQLVTPPRKSSKKSGIAHVPEKKVDLDEFVAKYESIIKEVNKFFSGMIVRYDQRNIHARVFSVLSNAFYDPEIFKVLHDKGLLEKTSYAGQWKIK